MKRKRRKVRKLVSRSRALEELERYGLELWRSPEGFLAIRAKQTEPRRTPAKPYPRRVL